MSAPGSASQPALQGPEFFDPARHAGALALAAARALRAGDIETAHRLADRRCRIRPPAEAHDFLLRATARRLLGDRDGALADAREAAAIDPDDRFAARMLLRSPEAGERGRAAQALLRSERDPALLAEAARVLSAEGVTTIGALRSDPLADSIAGWLAWADGPAPRLDILRDGSDPETLHLEADPSHPLRSVLGHAAEIRVAFPRDASFVAIHAPGGWLAETTFLREPRPTPRTRPPQEASARPHVTVIVPVYADLAATRRCLQTLLADTPRHVDRTIVLVDDASPDPALTALLDSHAAAGEVRLVRNPANLGFAASVNRGLAEAPGDVLILNADTVLPLRCLDRLARAARSAPDIGTVTPLSNNGEATSLPRPFVENPLPDWDELVAIDHAAAEANRGLTVELPNGTGFCLYVTAACLDAVGPLAVAFGRGYLEDVDFCLRAAQAGFRNVCAADVYVGHAGSRSFGAGKRALVVRNLRILEARHPGYERASAAFVAQDPLAPARAAIDARMTALRPASHLVVLGDGRAAHLGGTGEPTLVAEAALRAGRITLKLNDPDGGFPQGLVLEAPLGGGARLAAALARLPLAAVSCPDPENVPDDVLRALARLGLPDAAPISRPVRFAPAPKLARPSRAARVALIPGGPPGTARHVRLKQLVQAWTTRAEAPELVVVGGTPDDLATMAMGRVHVTGPVPVVEMPALLARLGVTRLIFPDPVPADHPVARLAAETGLPAAALSPFPVGVSLTLGPMTPAAASERLVAWAIEDDVAPVVRRAA
ncbi:MAG: glycosyltransferase family 2 protein [Methylobacteriaceae bacterium]|nr:glycosyltransferase family 2 protein [Methylobacteriaceae bacterium]